MITQAHGWVVKLLYRELTLGDLSILHCVLDGMGMPEEGFMLNGAYEFCRNRWILKWQELARQPLNAELKLKTITEYAEAAAAWNPRLRTCLAMPLIWNDTLLGVLSVYSSDQQGLSHRQAQTVMLLASEGLEQMWNDSREPVARTASDAGPASESRLGAGLIV